jgi:hypothetical protein
MFALLPPRQHGGDQDHEPRPRQAEENADPECQVQSRQYHRRYVDDRWLPLTSARCARPLRELTDLAYGSDRRGPYGPLAQTPCPGLDVIIGS